ncbi:SRPBCC family protein [Phycisphaeraceae bacterium D3-23]
MPTIQLDTDIAAPIERVFDLARSIDAHIDSTASTGEKAVAGKTSGLIELGEQVTWEARHFGVRQRLTVKVTRLDRPYVFEDVMLRGAFKSMRHTHEFTAHAGGTRMTDTFEFAAPLGPLGWLTERLFLTRYMRGFLFERSRVLKETAESERWKRYLVAGPEQQSP